MGWGMNSDQWIEKYRQKTMEQHDELFRHVLRRVGSPIEMVMAACLLAKQYVCATQYEWMQAQDLLRSLGVRKSQNILCADGESMAVVTQPSIEFDGYVITPDFGLFDSVLLNGESPRAIAVELDGHAFHERTKEQAARDKKRDRTLLTKGWSVIRFTGSEVIADPESVFDTWSEVWSAEAKKRGRL